MQGLANLLVILKLSGSAEVGQLVDDGAIVPDELHDVARLQVSEIIEKCFKLLIANKIKISLGKVRQARYARFFKLTLPNLTYSMIIAAKAHLK